LPALAGARQGLTRATRSTVEERFSVRMTFGEVEPVANAQQQLQLGRLARRLLAHVDVRDVGFGVADRRGDLREDALAVLDQQRHRGLERARRLLGPVDPHPALAVALEQALADAALGGVHRQASPRPRLPTIASPGIGRQHGASCTDAPSLPSIRTSPCDGAESSLP
jgi:hypothetical protein